MPVACLSKPCFSTPYPRQQQLREPSGLQQVPPMRGASKHGGCCLPGMHDMNLSSVLHTSICLTGLENIFPIVRDSSSNQQWEINNIIFSKWKQRARLFTWCCRSTHIGPSQTALAIQHIFDMLAMVAPN